MLVFHRFELYVAQPSPMATPAPCPMVNTFAGVVVPIPTLTANCPVPPSTRALLVDTRALDPIAAEFVSCMAVPGPALYPIQVLFEPEVLRFASVSVTPAW